MTKVEEVARAIAASEQIYSFDPTSPFDFEKDTTRLQKERYRKTTLVVIAAMREPTPAMIEAAGESGSLSWSLEPGEGLDGVSWDDAWRAMIDAALSEEKGAAVTRP